MIAPRLFSMTVLLAALVATDGALRAADTSGAKRIREIAEEFQEVGREFGVAAGQTIADNSQAKLDNVRLRYVDCMLKFHEIKAEAPKIDLDDSSEGKSLRIAFERWLKTQIENMQTAGLDYIVICEDSDLTSTERKDALLGLVDKQVKSEQANNERLTAALEAYENR